MTRARARQTVEAFVLTADEFTTNLRAYLDDGDALGALSLVTSRRKAADVVERVLVAEARRCGASWMDVARALGLSKTAAYERHKHSRS